MSGRFLVVLLTAVCLATPAIAGSIGIGSIGRGGADKPVIGTTGRTSVQAKTVKGSQKSGTQKNTIGENNSPLPQDR